MKLVFIHGRDQQGKDPAKLEKQWTESWEGGLRAADSARPAGVSIAFPFYGDLLDKLTKEVNAAPTDLVVERGGQADPKELKFRQELLNEIAKKQGITQEQIDAYFRGPAHKRGVLNWEWVQAILRALDEDPYVSASTVDGFTRDVYVYLNFPAVKRQINALVAEAIPQEPCVIVSHSLGTVVAYNVLRTLPAGRAYPLFVTLGSPLGVTTIRLGVESPLAVPAGVAKWFNAMDERDVVALYPLDAQRFNVQPPIENKTDVRNGTKNRHGISGYLSDRDVALKILKGLQAQ